MHNAEWEQVISKSSPVQVITNPSGTYPAVKEGDFWVVRCKILPDPIQFPDLKAVHGAVNFGRVGEAQYCIDGGAWIPLGKILGRGTEGAHLAVAVHLPVGQHQYVFAFLPAEPGSMQLKLSTDLGDIVDGFARDEIVANPRLAGSTRVNISASTSVYTSGHLTINLSVNGTDYPRTTPNAPSLGVEVPAPGADLFLTTSNTIHVTQTNLGAGQKKVVLKVVPRPFGP